MERRTALVTGASRGLGLALTAALAAQGWHVVVDGRDPDTLEAAISPLRHSSDGGSVITVVGDISDPEHRAALVAAGEGPIHLVINNAGGLGPSPLPALDAVPVDVVTALFAINVAAPLGLIQAALPFLAPGAVIVNVTSDASVEPYPGWGVYGTTKAALDHLGAVLAVEHPELRVLAIDPGDMRTVMHQAAFPGEDISDRPLPEEQVPAILALIEGSEPSGRYRAARAS